MKFLRVSSRMKHCGAGLSRSLQIFYQLLHTPNILIQEQNRAAHSRGHKVGEHGRQRVRGLPGTGGSQPSDGRTHSAPRNGAGSSLRPTQHSW